MLDCKPCSTPMIPKQDSPPNSDLFANATFYKELVGSLQYLLFARPDLAYSVNNVSQTYAKSHDSSFLADKTDPTISKIHNNMGTTYIQRVLIRSNSLL